MPALSLALPCIETFDDPEYLEVIRQCNGLGEIEYTMTRFKETGLVSLEQWYTSGRLSESKHYRDGEAITLSRFSYPSNLATYFIRHDYQLPEQRLIGKETIDSSSGEIISLSRLFFADNGTPSYEVFYNQQQQILKRNLLDQSGKIEKMVIFRYVDSESAKPYAFRIFDKNNKLLSEYDRTRQFDFDRVYQSLSDEQREIKRKHWLSSERIPVAVVDSGVDIFHPLLAYKMFTNGEDLFDGEDNDGNGLIDDYMGWAEPDKVGLPHESISPNEKGVPTSHGTHVASILSRDLEGIAILPFVGDYGESFFLDLMNGEFKEKRVQFANMSFSFPHYRTQQIDRKTINSLQRLIENNPQTLFFVASGNNGKELGNSVQQAMFPAVFPFDQVFTIGAIDTDSLDERKMPTYIMADYSNYSEMAVDILAPGTKVNGASLGGGMIRHTGTSMATPYALREALVLKQAYPHLTGLEIKEIMMRSAYIPDLSHPFPVRSGGMIFPRRALRVAELMEKQNLTILQATLAARLDGHFILPGEQADQAYLRQLQDFWLSRNM